jgi:hypothetical protein
MGWVNDPQKEDSEHSEGVSMRYSRLMVGITVLSSVPCILHYRFMAKDFLSLIFEMILSHVTL